MSWCTRCPFLIAGINIILIYYGTYSHIYHVKPSSFEPCLLEPCLTLSQLTATINSFINSESNLTFIFQPGDHNAQNTVFEIGEIRSLTWEKARRDVSNISTNTVTITCTKSSFVHLFRISKIYINGLDFLAVVVAGLNL